jgi:hypothetical protein
MRVHIDARCGALGNIRKPFNWRDPAAISASALCWRHELNLFVGIPSHSGTIVAEAACTLCGIQEMLISRGGRFHLKFLYGAVIHVSRNILSVAFLESDADALLMLDSDQAIEASAIGRMIDLGRPVVGCLYPKRLRNWTNAKPGPADEMLLQASEFVGELIYDEDKQAQVIDGFALADYVGTGVLLVRREAFEEMMKHFPALEGRGFGPDRYPEFAHTARWGFFNPLDSDVGPLSEDISFCRRWRQAGGEIWADVTTDVTHIGREIFKGNYLDYTRAVS